MAPRKPRGLSKPKTEATGSGSRLEKSVGDGPGVIPGRGGTLSVWDQQGKETVTDSSVSPVQCSKWTNLDKGLLVL